MYQKDYFLRHVEAFLNSLKELLLLIEKSDIEEFTNRVTKNYEFFNNSESYFKNSESNEIIQFLMKQENGLEKINLLAQLFMIDSKIKNATTTELIKKAIHLFEFYNQKNKTFSLDIMSKLEYLKGEIKNNS